MYCCLPGARLGIGFSVIAGGVLSDIGNHSGFGISTHNHATVLLMKTLSNIICSQDCIALRAPKYSDVSLEVQKRTRIKLRRATDHDNNFQPATSRR